LLFLKSNKIHTKKNIILLLALFALACFTNAQNIPGVSLFESQDEVNMTSLKTGPYFVKVKINDTITNFRVIKE